MRVELTPCYILHGNTYKESSLLLEVFSREHGRVSLIAKGVKKKKYLSAYQPYQSVSIAWINKSNLGVLTNIECHRQFSFNSFDKYASAFYLNEVILNLLHKYDPHADLYDAYEDALSTMSEQPFSSIPIRYFEKKLLKSLGYGLILDHEVETDEPIQADKHYYYHPNQGAMQKDQSGSIPIAGDTLLSIDNETISNDKQSYEAKRLMRCIIAQKLNKPLTSRELYAAYLDNQRF